MQLLQIRRWWAVLLLLSSFTMHTITSFRFLLPGRGAVFLQRRPVPSASRKSPRSMPLSSCLLESDQAITASDLADRFEDTLRLVRTESNAKRKVEKIFETLQVAAFFQGEKAELTKQKGNVLLFTNELASRSLTPVQLSDLFDSFRLFNISWSDFSLGDQKDLLRLLEKHFAWKKNDDPITGQRVLGFLGTIESAAIKEEYDTYFPTVVLAVLKQILLRPTVTPNEVSFSQTTSDSSSLIRSTQLTSSLALLRRLGFDPRDLADQERQELLSQLDRLTPSLSPQELITSLLGLGSTGLRWGNFSEPWRQQRTLLWGQQLPALRPAALVDLLGAWAALGTPWTELPALAEQTIDQLGRFLEEPAACSGEERRALLVSLVSQAALPWRQLPAALKESLAGHLANCSAELRPQELLELLPG